MMRNYLDDKFDRELPQMANFDDKFEEDQQKLKATKNGPNKNVKNLISRIDQIVKIKEDTLDSINSDHPKNSCFGRNLDKIRASFELDEHSNKAKLHKYVESLSASK